MRHSRKVGKVVFFIKGIFHLYTTHHFLDSSSGDFSNPPSLSVVWPTEEFRLADEYGSHILHHYKQQQLRCHSSVQKALQSNLFWNSDSNTMFFFFNQNIHRSLLARDTCMLMISAMQHSCSCLCAPRSCCCVEKETENCLCKVISNAAVRKSFADLVGVALPRRLRLLF